MKKSAAIILILISGCINDVPATHIHHIVNYDTTSSPYHIRWYCDICSRWLETIELNKIDYSEKIRSYEKVRHR